jgi:hypothetical protein
VTHAASHDALFIEALARLLDIVRRARAEGEMVAGRTFSLAHRSSQSRMFTLPRWVSVALNDDWSFGTTTDDYGASVELLTFVGSESRRQVLSLADLDHLFRLADDLVARTKLPDAEGDA